LTLPVSEGREHSINNYAFRGEKKMQQTLLGIIFALVATTACAGLGNFEKETDYVRYCTGTLCVEGNVSLSAKTMKHVEYINGVIDRLNLLEFFANYAMPLWNVISATDVGSHYDAHMNFYLDGWDKAMTNFAKHVPLAKLAILKHELNYIIYEEVKRNAPNQDRAFWVEFKKTVMKAMDRLNGRSDCEGIYCGTTCYTNRPNIDCQLYLRKPLKQWRAKVTISVCGRKNEIDIENSTSIDMDEKDGSIEIINEKDPRNKFYGEFSKDRNSMNFSSWFKGDNIWRANLKKQ
jgi:hypothetical protein